MTTDLVRIFRIDPCETRTPGLTQWVIWATLVARPTTSLQVQTLNAYAASLCQRARDLERPIAITHQRTAYGETLVKAHFLKAEAVA